VRGVPDSRFRLISGYWALATFTVWCWMMLGVYFVLSGAASLTDACGLQRTCSPSKFSANFLWVLFQMMFSYACLVCLVVWLILLPATYIKFGAHHGLLSFPAISMHNANVLFMLVEMRLNRLTFVRSHVVFTLYFGCAYVVFSWLWYLKTHLFFYFFIDMRSPIVFAGYTMLLTLICGMSISCENIVKHCKLHVKEELPELSHDSSEVPCARSSVANFQTFTHAPPRVDTGADEIRSSNESAV